MVVKKYPKQSMIAIVENEVWHVGAARGIAKAAKQQHPPIGGEHIRAAGVIQVGCETVKCVIRKVYGPRDYTAIVEINSLLNRNCPVPWITVGGACLGEKRHAGGKQTH